MRVLVCGGRDYSDREHVYAELTRLHAESKDFWFLIHGAARGADTLAAEWAEWIGVPHQAFRADWKRLRKAAGAIRNQQMLDEGKPDLVVAFPGGVGTADMIRRAERAGIRVVRIT